ncbi:MAG TPA: rhomboid family intramembrane serine protease [Thermomicrobiaceae bacterium]|nr:rhomboid family intramembrane serine protease [Thermomicrobiaceae bacterium]
MRRLPLVTALVFLATAVVTGAQFFSPSVLSALRRNPEALAAGQWWRILSPLLVDPDGWLAIAGVALGLLVVGTVCERLFGRARWLLLYFAGALAGELAGYAWEPYDAGSSIALCGLIGGLIVVMLGRLDFSAFSRAQGPLGLLAALYALGLVGAWLGSATGGAVIAVLLGALLASALIWLTRLGAPGRFTAGYFGSAGLIAALALVALRDIHGPSLLAGAAVAALLCWLDPTLGRAGDAGRD